MSERKAAALRYRRGRDAAPVVVATGQGPLAEYMEYMARLHDVPVYRDPQLAEALVRLVPGTAIPPRLYEAVARILAFVLSVDAHYPATDAKD